MTTLSLGLQQTDDRSISTKKSKTEFPYSNRMFNWKIDAFILEIEVNLTHQLNCKIVLSLED